MKVIDLLNWREEALSFEKEPSFIKDSAITDSEFSIGHFTTDSSVFRLS